MRNQRSYQGAFLEIVTRMPQEVEHLLGQFGFCERVHRDERVRARLFTQGDMSIFLKEGLPTQSTLTPFLTSVITRVGLFAPRADRIGSFLSPETDLVSPIGVGFCLMERQAWQAWQDAYVPPQTKPSQVLVTHIDHVAINVAPVQRDEMGAWCEAVLGLRALAPHKIQGARTHFVCSPFESPCGAFSVVLNTSTDTSSQIVRYLTQAGGAGVQHIALASSHILETIKELRTRGVPFISVPQTYYQGLEERGLLTRQERLVFQEGSLLLDQEEGKSEALMQTFTTDLLGPFFLEVIERRDRRGFGEGNIQALFKAVETHYENVA